MLLAAKRTTLTFERHKKTIGGKKMTKFFKVDARALISLGRDNARDRFTALLELAKNSYDAGAQVVKISIDASSEDVSKREIRILDNGSGMTPTQLEEHWLTVGYSHKRDMPISSDKRIQTGEKGIGRLSADRLGSTLKLTTKSKGTPAIGISVDWKKFEGGKTPLGEIPLDEITNPNIDLDRLPQPGDMKSIRRSSGTELRINNLRDKWTEQDIHRLLGELETMISPLIRADTFAVFLESDVAPLLNGQVSIPTPPSYAVLELTASIDEQGFASYSISQLEKKSGSLQPFDKSPQPVRWTDYVSDGDDENDNDEADSEEDGSHEYEEDEEIDIVNGGRYPLEIPTPATTNPAGPFSITLRYIPQIMSLMSSDAFKYLKEHSDSIAGVKVFRDGVIVKPYGIKRSPAFDWLALGARQASRPAPRSSKHYRLKPMQISGVIDVSRVTNPRLIDTSGREGLVQNEAFHYISACVLFCIRLVEIAAHKIYKPQKRKKRDTPRSQLKALKLGVKRLRSKLEEVRPLLEGSGQELVRETDEELLTFEKLLRRVGSDLEEVTEEILSLRALSTTAIASAVFAHETTNHLQRINGAMVGINALVESSPIDKDAVNEEVEKAQYGAKQLLQLGKFTLNRLRRDRRTAKQVNWGQIVARVIKDLRPMLEYAGIEVSYSCPEPIFAMAYQSDLESVLVNLIINAYQAVTTPGIENRKLTIKLLRTKPETDGYAHAEFVVADSGGGVDKGIREKIWYPLFTTRSGKNEEKNGTGLGLWIVDSTVRDQGGERFCEDSELGGAEFRIVVPLKKEKKNA